MKQIADGTFRNCLRGVAIAIVASAAVAAPAAYAKPYNKLIFVSPTELPSIARQGGDAMFLHQTLDGTTLLYVEQDNGSVLAVLDVTDPGHVKAEGSVQLGAPGAFDFVSALGDESELIRFRQGQQDAVLDLHKIKKPTLKQVPGLTVPGQTMLLGGDGFMVSTPLAADAQSTHDYQVVDAASAERLDRVFNVKRVRQEIANQASGTTFLLADNGLYLIRRPAVEAQLQFRQSVSAN
jgi:hypothetical protein